jgi:general secretion pathway protein J
MSNRIARHRILPLSTRILGIARDSPAVVSVRRSRVAKEVARAGFTLLEILVVLAVLGLLLVGLLQENRFVLLGWDKQNRLAAASEDLDSVERTLRHLIEHAAPASKWDAVTFAGSSHSVTFTSVLPSGMAGLPTRRADVKLAADGAHRLVLLWTPHVHAIRIGPPPRALTTEILQGVSQLDLAYLPAQGAAWVPAWHDATPPRLVRIRIVFAESGHEPWPDMIAAPILDAQ